MESIRRLIVGIAIIVLFIGAMVFILTSSWGRDTDEVVIDDDVSNLVEQANTDLRVRFVTRGRINSNQEHRQVDITVGRDTTRVQVFEGYRERILRSERYSNNPDAYEVFLAALMNSGFTDTKPAPRDIEVLGACPRQQQYFFEVLDGNEVIFDSWSTQCSRNIGTFDGRLQDTIWLFRQQIPDYNDIVSGIRL